MLGSGYTASIRRDHDSGPWWSLATAHTLQPASVRQRAAVNAARGFVEQTIRALALPLSVLDPGAAWRGR